MAQRTCLALAVLFIAGAALAEPPAALCKRVGTDDTLRAIPPSLVPQVGKVFDLPAEAAGQSYFRCAGGNVMVCTVGANLPCGKANTSRSLPSVNDYCRANPGAAFVPMVVTGHDTIFNWHCTGTAAVADGPAEQVDDRGFITRLWRALP
jgi:hypothetical protein